MKPELALCYYPTAVAFIDDNPNFLAAVRLSMGAQLNCVTFSDPLRALNHANLLNNVNWNTHSSTDCAYYSDSEQFIKNILNLSVNRITDHGRFEEISVVVVDYDMPEMNGLDFCRNLKNPNIKKILLTGQAGSDEAIGAFNSNLIDYYIKKSDDNLYQHLTRAIYELQNRYFLDISSYIKIRAIDNKKSLFNDAKLSAYFARILEENDIVEYYFMTNPPRYKLRSRSGVTSNFLVYSRSDINEQIRVILEEAGPQWLVDCLQSELYVPWFDTSDGFYDQEEFSHERTLFIADVIRGQDTYYCAHVKDETRAFEPAMAATSDQLH